MLIVIKISFRCDAECVVCERQSLRIVLRLKTLFHLEGAKASYM